MLAVRLTAMTNGHDVNKLFSVNNPIHNTPLAGSDAPQINCALKLCYSSGPRTDHERFDVFENAQSDRRIKRLKLFACRACKDDRVFSHALCTWP